MRRVPMVLDARRGFTLAAGLAWLMATLYLTLHAEAPVNPVPFWSLWVETMAGMDIAQNIVLFVPLGWIAHRARWPLWRCALAGMVISGGIEFVQQWVPGRTTQASDIAFNASGAALGWWMATAVVRPRLRVALSLAALAGFLGLHALNTSWPGQALRADGVGGWQGLTLHECGSTTWESTVCLTLPNTVAGNRYLRVVGPGERTYARMQAWARSARMSPGDCFGMEFESTYGAIMRLRTPYVSTCSLVGDSDPTIEVSIHPRLEHLAAGAWTPTRVGVWMWPVWPFVDYDPGMLRAVGALTFVILASLFVGTAVWGLPVGYLLSLSVASYVTGMRGPAVPEFAWSVIAWLGALLVVRFDAWWRSGGAATRSDRGLHERKVPLTRILLRHSR
jgi:hypothetical protein